MSLHSPAGGNSLHSQVGECEGKKFMNRDSKGRFSSFVRKVKNFIKTVIIYGLVISSIVAGIYGFVYYKYNYSERASATITQKVPTTTPPTLDQRWEENYKKDVELEMQRSGFKKEIEEYARQIAESRVRQAYMTKIEQKLSDN